MRIISGKHKGRKIPNAIKLPVRPTTDQAKEALFNILENSFYFNNIAVLDLFSGTGNISYEFSSRGCKDIICIDENYRCIKFIKKNIKELDLEINYLQSDCLKFLKGTDKNFDVIFADPPYNYNYYYELKDIIFKREILNENGVLILEHDKSIKFDGKNIDSRKYGNVHFSIFKNNIKDN